MKKTRGKKKVSVSQKVTIKKSFDFKDHILFYVTIAILLICGVLLFFNQSPTGNVTIEDGGVEVQNAEANVINVLEGPVPDFGKAIISFFNVGVPESLGIGNTWKELIIAIIVFMIILAGIYNILTLVSIFDKVWVIWVMTVGLAIIAALTGIIRGITIFMVQFAAGLGAIAIVLEIIISIVIFIGLSIGSTWIAKWAAKRKAQTETIKAIKGAGEAGAAITGLKAIQKSFKEK